VLTLLHTSLKMRFLNVYLTGVWVGERERERERDVRRLTGPICRQIFITQVAMVMVRPFSPPQYGALSRALTGLHALTIYTLMTIRAHGPGKGLGVAGRSTICTTL
jgi:hypothetical protein